MSHTQTSLALDSEPEPRSEPLSPELEGFELTVSRVEPPLVDLPAVDEPTADAAGDAETSGPGRQVALAVYYFVLGHAAVAAGGLGGVLAAGRGRVALGGRFLAAGVVLAAYAAHRYRNPPRPPRTRRPR